MCTRMVECVRRGFLTARRKKKQLMGQYKCARLVTRHLCGDVSRECVILIHINDLCQEIIYSVVGYTINY